MEMVNWNEQCKRLISQIEEEGGSLPKKFKRCDSVKEKEYASE